jgi:cytochrome c oxidase subunit I
LLCRAVSHAPFNPEPTLVSSPNSEFEKAARRCARDWLLVSLGSLLVSGLFAALLVAGRTPVLDQLLGSPIFFRRALVVHVNLALLVWFHAFAIALLHLVAPKRRAPRRWPAMLGAAGVTLLIIATVAPGTPILSNYIPVIAHPVFFIGLGVTATGLVAAFAGWWRWGAGASVPSTDSAAVRIAIAVSAMVFLVAISTFGISLVRTPAGMVEQSYFEALFWGGGHVLQIANVAAMMAVWLLLLERLIGRPPVSATLAVVAFGFLLLAALTGPLLAATGTTSALYRQGFTLQMQWGIFPATTVVLVACIVAVVRAVRAGRLRTWDPVFLAIVASASMTVLGFVLGALIRGSTTLTPAHYHASIGAVTVAFMAVTPLLLVRTGMARASRRRGLSVAPVVFAFGQTIFALGFALAGWAGAGRKAYASDQVVHSAMEVAGLLVMALGGLGAMGGGALFLWGVLALLFSRAAVVPTTRGATPWQVSEGIRSNG